MPIFVLKMNFKELHIRQKPQGSNPVALKKYVGESSSATISFNQIYGILSKVRLLKTEPGSIFRFSKKGINHEIIFYFQCF